MSVEEDLQSLAAVVVALQNNSGMADTQASRKAWPRVVEMSRRTPPGPLVQAVADIPVPPKATTNIDTSVRVVDIVYRTLQAVGAAVRVGTLNDVAWAVLGSFDREGWKVVCRGCGLEPDMTGIEHLKAVSDGTEDGADVVCLHPCRHAVEGDRVCRACFGDREPF